MGHSRLPDAVQQKILAFPEYRMGVHRVALILNDGRVIEDVLVAWGNEVVRVGNGDPQFRPGDVVDALHRP